MIPEVAPGTEPAPAARPSGDVGLVNVANTLTVLRLLLVPAFVVALLADEGRTALWRAAACTVFAVASGTDHVDGWLARRRGLVTAFGQLADPIVDKVLIGAALVGLSLLGELPWWVTIVVLVREVGVTALRFRVIRHGVIPASRGGKLKTLLQGIAIGCYLLPFRGTLASLRWWLMATAVVVTVVTGADYVARAAALRRAGTRR